MEIKKDNFNYSEMLSFSLRKLRKSFSDKLILSYYTVRRKVIDPGDEIMRQRINHIRRNVVAGMAIAFGIFLSFGSGAGMTAFAEESVTYLDDTGNWSEEFSDESAGIQDVYTMEENAEAVEKATGNYTVEAGWSVDSDSSTADKSVYKQDGMLESDDTSTVSCSYMDTNYSVLEYEQLRDMLTNNLLYSNVNAQISASAVYTNAKDYLYILLVDDTSLEYRNIYCYVVGDYRCFCVEVKEYRSEAEQLRSQELKTPQEVGQSIAEGFVWN